MNFLPIYRLLLIRCPRSYNSWSEKKKEREKIFYESEFKSVYPDSQPLQGELYGKVYYFHRKPTGLDADNISKPVWDCLGGLFYDDDKQVKLRTAGVFDFSNNRFHLLNVSGMDGRFLPALLDAIVTEDHVLYIECGPLDQTMFLFG